MEKNFHSSAPEEELELMSRAAWLYYVAQLNQNKVAEQLGITRARTNRLLQEALQQGIVNISIDHKFLGSHEKEQQLCEKFSLKECHIVPCQKLNKTSEIARRAVGAQAALLLERIIEKNTHAIIGFGWGRTLVAMVKQMRRRDYPDLRFISLMGSLTPTTAVNPFEVIQMISNILGAKGYYLPVPFITDSIEDHDIFLSQKFVQTAIQLARKTDYSFISVGELSESSLLFKTGMLSTEELKELDKAGAVGDTNGLFFNTQGLPVEHSLNQRTISVRFERLKNSYVHLLAAGIEKKDATKALLKSGIINALIIDEDLAKQILQDKN